MRDIFPRNFMYVWPNRVKKTSCDWYQMVLQIARANGSDPFKTFTVAKVILMAMLRQSDLVTT